ncbi:hypothetical protein EB844_20460 [Paracoccus pantotrophus]|nr:hypothetical protein EB844_20460 [Paracoccus pantotrophus]
MGLAAAAAPFVVTRGWAQGPAPFRFALTPVFLDNDAAVISALRAALAEGMGQDIELVQRRTYQEISGALLDGSVDAAWTCGYPYLQHKTELSLLGVPVWRGQPLYQSYLIVAQDDPATALSDLRGGAHAFSDPDSNSGFLVTASDLARDRVRQRGVISALPQSVWRRGSILALNSSGPARPYMARLRVFRRLI